MITSHDSLMVSEKAGVVEITLNRPELLNRFDAVLETELTDVLRRLAEDDQARVAVLLAEGRAFSAGGDFDLMLEVKIQDRSSPRPSVLAGRDVGARRSALCRDPP